MTNTRKTAAKKTARKTTSRSNGEVYNVTSLGRRFVLSDVISDIKQDRPPIEVEGADGVVFAIPPAELWPDEAINLAGEDNEACCRLLLGDQYDEWVRQGGTFGVLNRIVAESAGASVGKSAGSSSSSGRTAKKSNTTSSR